MFKHKLVKSGLMKKGLASLMALCLCAGMALPVGAVSQDMTTAHLTEAEKQVLNEQAQKKRINTIVSTDGEHDDMASMIRYLTMANEFNTEAIVLTASAAGHHTGGNITYPNQEAVDALTDSQKSYIESESTNEETGEVTVTYRQNRWTGFRWIHYFIEKYGEVYDNLKVHDSNYPTPEYLESVVKYGNVKVVGDMQEETEGSEFIKERILNNPDGEPLYIQHWGGANTTARALKSIEEEYKGTDQWDNIVNKINNEVTLYMIWERQAPTYVSYIAPNWPGIRTIVNSNLFFSFYRMWTQPQRHSQKTQDTWFKDAWGDTILGIGSPLTNEALMQVPFNLSNSEIQNPDNKFYTEPVYDASHGQSEADNFPFETWGDSQSRNSKDTHYFEAEGDSPSYFFIMDNGLRSYEDPSWGSWAGRFEKAKPDRPNEYEDVSEDTVPEGSTVTPANYTFSRWVPDIQAEYSAHAKWSVTSNYKYANHHPKAAVMNGLDLEVTAGETIHLDGVAYDPDGDELTYKWWRYADADTHKDVGTIYIADTEDTDYTVPADAKVGDTIHLIFEVSDSKDNDLYTSLKNYKRVILTVTDKTSETPEDPEQPQDTPQPGQPQDTQKPQQTPSSGSDQPAGNTSVTPASYTVKNSVYKISANGTASYVRPASSKAKSVVVPSAVKINGKKYKITSIAKKAFAGQKKLTKVVIGKNVTQIGKKAFYNAKNLKNIAVKSKKLTKKNVGAKAFAKAGSKNYRKLIVKMPKSKKKAYTKLFVQKGLNRKAVIR